MKREEVSILIVDDVNTIRVQVKELLKSFGFRKISVAQSGIEAQMALQTETFHLILCDWHMSPMDGIELLKFVRTDPKLIKIAFIMVTAESTKEKVVEAIQSGVDDYLVKPLTPLQIQNKVYGALLRKMS